MEDRIVKNNKMKIHMIRMIFILACCFILGISIHVSDVYAKDTNGLEELRLLTGEQYDEDANYKIDEKNLKKNREKSDVNSKMISIIDKMKGKPSFLDNCSDVNIIADGAIQPLNNISPATIPVSKITPRIINAESLKNGEITTDTQIAWFWDFSDADGDTMIDFQYGGFPSAYFLGAFERGFITQFTDPGDYTVLYRALDSGYEYSEIDGYRVHVVPVEDYEVIEDEFTSSTDEKTYHIDIDFSNIQTAAVCLVNMGESTNQIKVSDSEGNLIKGSTVSNRVLKNWCSIEKPSPDASVISYTITATSTTFVEEASSFRIIWGDEKDLEAMMGGPENASPLGWFRETDNNFVNTGYTPNNDEYWFRIHPEQAMVTFTLLTKHPELRFKILDTDNLGVLFDSNESSNENVHRNNNFCLGFQGCEKAKISGWTLGEDYYLVMYASNRFTTQDLVKDNVSVSVGFPRMASGLSDSIYATRQITATSSDYSSDAIIQVQCDGITLPRNSYVYQAEWMGDRPSIMSSWRIKEPQSYTWKKCIMSKKTIDIDYEKDSNSNTLMNGTWRAGFKTSLGTGTHTFHPALRFYYKYELGD